MTDGVTRALAELRRRREQHRLAATDYWGDDSTTGDRCGDEHDHIARGLTTAIDVLEGIGPDAAQATASDDELEIVEVTETGAVHRRRRYTPADGDADAHLELARFNADGWRVTGEDRLAQVALNGTRLFDD